MKKDSKIRQIPGTNISQENIKGYNNIFLQINKYKIIEEILDTVCSENPIDPQKTKGWMKASIKLIEPNTIVRVKPMCYSPQDRIEFTKQIKELLEMKLIIQSKSPHMSPAFLVENEAEKRRGKKRMVVNYKKINEATIGDSHNLYNMQELLTLLRGKHIFSSFDCKSGFWQVLLDEQSQLLTAFTCPDGHFQWKVVPFGLKQAPKQKIALLEATTTVTDVSESKSLKTKAIPEQTAPGKESTNPLKAEVLLKSLTKDNTDPNSLSKTSKLVHSSPPTTDLFRLYQEPFTFGLANSSLEQQ
nr:TPA: orf y [Tanacetum cinerariifolium]